MARSTDYLCDLTGEAIRLASIPIVVRIQVGVPPGALVDPPRERIAELSPFLARMLFHPNGSARAGVLELSAASFARHVVVDTAGLESAFEGAPAPNEQEAQLRATVHALEAERRRAASELARMEALLERERATVASLSAPPVDGSGTVP
jgi:hypothetical protein